MKKLLVLFASVALISCNENSTTKTTEEKKDSINVQKGDLSRAGWLNGNWKGLFEGKPFYEQYELRGDTLHITGYELKDSDTSGSSFSTVAWNNGYYYLGDSMQWKVTAIEDREIRMLPNYKAANDITWSFQDSNTWVAILKGPTTTNTYKMERIPPIDSLKKKK